MAEDPSSLIEGADKLVSLYGYWLSFHDAVVESILIARAGPAETKRFVTNDAVLDPEDGSVLVCVRQANVVIRWHEVRDLVLSGIDGEENNWINGLEFVRSGDAIYTLIERMDGPHGFILAPRVEVLNAEVVSRDLVK